MVVDGGVGTVEPSKAKPAATFSGDDLKAKTQASRDFHCRRCWMRKSQSKDRIPLNRQSILQLWKGVGRTNSTN